MLVVSKYRYGHPSFVLSFACIQYRGFKTSEKCKQFYQNDFHNLIDPSEYTWVGHCVVTLIVEDKEKNLIKLYLAFPKTDERVHYELNNKLCNIELIRKPYPDSVMESALRSLLTNRNKISDLCRRIVVGSINDTKKNRFDSEKFNKYLKNCIEASSNKLNMPNKKQHEAMLTAFSEEFSLIQGFILIFSYAIKIFDFE